MVIGRYVTRGEVPHEQRFSRMKHSPGSGVLSVKVVSDGPTRILRITDENKKVWKQLGKHISCVCICETPLQILLVYVIAHGCQGNGCYK